MKSGKYKQVFFLRGISTLDVIKINSRIFLLTLIIMIFGSSIYGGHSILDLVDPTFNPQIQTNAYGLKWVNQIQALPDGKILALGGFNTYNGAPVGKFIRLNPDGSLDTSFNNLTVTDVQSFYSQAQIIIQPDGKIVLKSVGLTVAGQTAKPILRLNADGTFDPTFNFILNNFIYIAKIDSFGRFVLMGDFTTPNGARRLIRLNNDGSLDNTFNFTLPANTTLNSMSLQGDKPVIVTGINSSRQLSRLNEDGSADSSFTPVTGTNLTLIEVQQPNNKVLYQNNSFMLRLDENGGNDNTFQPTALTQGFHPGLVKFTTDGKIVGSSSTNFASFQRILPNGGNDSSFNQYTAVNFATFAILADDSMLIGDGYMGGASNGSSSNNFVKLTPAGFIDPTFNQGGSGFQNVNPALIQAIAAYPDGKILLGGKFDLINSVSRIRLARINPDSTIDTTFQVNTTSGSGNYFSIIRDIYQISSQADGKIVVSGFFDYVLNGVTKQNLVRLNPDGSIDAGFNLTQSIPDYSQIIFGGQNRFATYGDGKLMVGTSRNSTFELSGPIKLTQAGARDTSFNPTLNGTSSFLFFDDVAIQPDGKILAVGSYNSSGTKSFIARFNADGSIDSTFTYTEEPNRIKMRISLLPTGKILISKNSGIAKVQRLNSNGSLDTSFNTLSFSDTAARINALLVLPNGKIFVGGSFTITENGQTRKNLLQLNADGNLEPTVYSLNNEVLCLAADGEGRVLVGGGFTVIASNGNSGEIRSFAARLTDSRARYDFDGDGRSDLGVYDAENGSWSIVYSRNNASTSTNFGLASDKTVPADFDGDGKTDIAVYRPAEGIWYLLQSTAGFKAVRWGLAEDKPVPADFDGDGKADIAVFRPSNGTWYILQSSDNQFFAAAFGQNGDIPFSNADFDGDSKNDIAVFRPLNSTFYWLESGSQNAFRAIAFGQTSDIPAMGDYNGDGKTDLCVFRPSNGTWYQYLSSQTTAYNFAAVNFGLAGDIPIPADYDGDGKTDIAVRRNNNWYLLRSGQGFFNTIYGNPNHRPIAAATLQ